MQNPIKNLYIIVICHLLRILSSLSSLRIPLKNICKGQSANINLSINFSLESLGCLEVSLIMPLSRVQSLKTKYFKILLTNLILVINNLSSSTSHEKLRLYVCFSRNLRKFFLTHSCMNRF